jgi:gamma-glutamyltranspeptidase
MFDGPSIAQVRTTNLAGWAELVASHGTKSLGDVLEPAISLARDGFPLLPGRRRMVLRRLGRNLSR